MADTVLLVSILSLPCLANTNKLLKSFHDLGYPAKERIKVIINRYLKNPEISLEDAEAGIKHKIFRTIANDYRTTISAINQGKPLPKVAPKATITKNVRELAEALVAVDGKQEKKGWSLFRRN